MTTVTWTTTPIPAGKLEPGDKVTIGSTTVTLETAEEWGQCAILGPIQGWIDDWTIQVHYLEPVTVHVPDEPVDGYNLFKPHPGWSPLGCTCLSRRDDDGNWTIVAHRRRLPLSRHPRRLLKIEEPRHD